MCSRSRGAKSKREREGRRGDAGGKERFARGESGSRFEVVRRGRRVNALNHRTREGGGRRGCSRASAIKGGGREATAAASAASGESRRRRAEKKNGDGKGSRARAKDESANKQTPAAAHEKGKRPQ